MALLIGCESMAAKQGMAADPGADAALLNGAIGLEDQAIGAYQLALESGLLTAQVRPVATLFQSHHQRIARHWPRPSRNWAAARRGRSHWPAMPRRWMPAA